MLQKNDVDVHVPVKSCGAHSLPAVNRRDWVREWLRADVAFFETQGRSTFVEIGNLVTGRDTLEYPAWTM